MMFNCLFLLFLRVLQMCEFLVRSALDDREIFSSKYILGILPEFVSYGKASCV